MPTTLTKLFFERALLTTGWADSVLIDVGNTGLIESIEHEARPGNAVHRSKVAVPGLGNLHSHAFQRGMAGLAEHRAPMADHDGREESFWTWREVMYRFLERLTPEDVEAIAAQLFVEMLESGFTSVGEFHYLHHAPDGTRYGDACEMSRRIIEASRATSIGLTHLPVFYRNGDWGAEPSAGQRRFLHEPAAFGQLVDRLRRDHPDIVIGVAPHSIRTVTPDSLLEVLAAKGRPVHMHAAEQESEVAGARYHLGAPPVRWLLDHAGVDERWCLIHCTHMEDDEVRDLATSGAVAGLCPITEANLGDGLFRGVEYLRAGGCFGIGSDSNIRVDLADELRTLEYGQRLRDRRRLRLSLEHASVGRSLFEAALKGGAQALARPIGGLAQGQRADIVSLDTEHPALVGKKDDGLLDGWIFAARTSPIVEVFVGGRRVVEEGRHIASEAIAQRYRDVIRKLSD